MSDVITERGDLVPDGWAEIYRRARTDNYDGLSNGATVLVITELASWQARAEQAEAENARYCTELAQARLELATSAAWKKDADDKNKLIEALTQELDLRRSELEKAEARADLFELRLSRQEE